MTAAVAIPLILAAGTAATSAYGAVESNKATKRSMRSAAQAGQIRANQNARSAALERQKRLNELRQIRGRIAVSAAERGVGIGDSFEALQQQAEADSSLNRQIISANESANFSAIQSGVQADIASLMSRISNPLIAAFGGGIQGAGAGLQLADGLDRLTAPPPPTVDTPTVPTP